MKNINISKEWVKDIQDKVAMVAIASVINSDKAGASVAGAKAFLAGIAVGAVMSKHEKPDEKTTKEIVDIGKEIEKTVLASAKKKAKKASK